MPAHPSAFFPRLARRESLQTSRAGRVFSVPLLPVSALGSLFDILSSANPDSPETVVSARHEIFKLISPVLPKELRDDLPFLDYPAAAQLARELAFGIAHDTKIPSGEKNSPPADIRSIDLEFQAARILHAFPGYTVSSLLAEPAPVFFALMGLALRIAKDDALETLVPAVALCLSGEGREALEDVRGPMELDHNSESGQQPFTKEQYEASLARMKDPDLKVISSITKASFQC